MKLVIVNLWCSFYWHGTSSFFFSSSCSRTKPMWMLSMNMVTLPYTMHASGAMIKLQRQVYQYISCFCCCLSEYDLVVCCLQPNIAELSSLESPILLSCQDLGAQYCWAVQSWEPSIVVVAVVIEIYKNVTKLSALCSLVLLSYVLLTVWCCWVVCSWQTTVAKLSTFDSPVLLVQFGWVVYFWQTCSADI